MLEHDAQDSPENPQDAASGSPSEPHDPVPIHPDRHIERLNQYIEGALEQTDSLQAVVDAAAGEMLLFSHRLTEAINQTLKDSPDPMSSIAQHLPSFSLRLKYGQQAQQYIHLGHKLRKQKEASNDSSFKSPAQSKAHDRPSEESNN